MRRWWRSRTARRRRRRRRAPSTGLARTSWERPGPPPATRHRVPRPCGPWRPWRPCASAHGSRATPRHQRGEPLPCMASVQLYKRAMAAPPPSLFALGLALEVPLARVLQLLGGARPLGRVSGRGGRGGGGLRHQRGESRLQRRRAPPWRSPRPLDLVPNRRAAPSGRPRQPTYDAVRIGGDGARVVAEPRHVGLLEPREQRVEPVAVDRRHAPNVRLALREGRQ